MTAQRTTSFSHPRGCHSRAWFVEGEACALNKADTAQIKEDISQGGASQVTTFTSTKLTLKRLSGKELGTGGISLSSHHTRGKLLGVGSPGVPGGKALSPVCETTGRFLADLLHWIPFRDTLLLLDPTALAKLMSQLHSLHDPHRRKIESQRASFLELEVQGARPAKMLPLSSATGLLWSLCIDCLANLGYSLRTKGPHPQSPCLWGRESVTEAFAGHCPGSV